MLESSLSYMGGKVLIVEDCEIDHLDIASIHNVYKEQLNYENLEHLYVMELGLSITEGLYFVEDNHGMMKILSKMNGDTDVLEFFAIHDIDAPIYALLTSNFMKIKILMHLHWRMELINQMSC